ncbi:YciI family protein [Jiella endophytica]|uniref:YciI family protein n=1 Tax=Jiella endophytica TaxID=2558362 RepID=A0A4Y8RAM1_9HYPH|nr:YciI-like protein [Jiella endophytica]TFF18080.1 YciI family protein [Jiella endophytica]
MLYAVICTDKPGHLQVRLDTRPEHLAYLTSLGKVLKFAGPFLGPDEKPTGSLLVVEADSLDAAEAIAAGDPYAKAGLFSNVAVTRWNWTVNNPDAA